MKSKTLAFATLLLITAFLLTQAIAPHTALADATWSSTGGGVSSSWIGSLAYDSGHNVLYAGGKGVWKYDGTNWTNTGGAVSSYDIISLAYDSVHNLLYAGIGNHGVWKYDGATWSDTGGDVSSRPIGSLAYDSGHNLLYAGYCGNGWGVQKYDGTNWGDTGGAGGGLSEALTYDSGHNLLYAGTDGQGVWKYDGATWSNTGGGVSGDTIRSLAYDSTHNVLYAGTDGHQGAWKYDGTNWSNTGGDVSSYRIYSLAYDSVHNLLYAGTLCNGAWKYGSQGVWKYDGTNWSNTGGEVSSYDIYSLAYDSGHNLLYAGGGDFGTFTGIGVWKYSGGGPSPSPTPSTPPNFNSYIVLQNPNAQTANVTLTYMMEDGVKQEATAVDPTSRKTLNLNDSVGAGKMFSIMVSSSIPIIAERPMYFNYKTTWNGGHDVVGATAAASTFYFAEGTTRPNFDPYICIQNPGSTAANITITYMKGDGTTDSQHEQIPKNTRATFLPRSKLGTGDDTAHDFSTKVECTNGGKIIAERPMYFNYKPGTNNWNGGLDVVGATAPSSAFYFAEGTCRPSYDPYICIQNPGGTAANVTLTYMKGDGSTATDQVTVAPNSRSTVNPRSKLGTGDDTAHDFSTKVECTNGGKIIAERPMYFNYKTTWNGGHDVVGATAPSSAFYFAEGYTGQ